MEDIVRDFSTRSSWTMGQLLLKGFLCSSSCHVLILWFHGEGQDFGSRCRWIGVAHVQCCLHKINHSSAIREQNQILAGQCDLCAVSAWSCPSDNSDCHDCPSLQLGLCLMASVGHPDQTPCQPRTLRVLIVALSPRELTKAQVAESKCHWVKKYW